MKTFVMLALVAGFVSVGSARAESPYRCAEEVAQWCSYYGSGVRSPEGFKNYLSRNATFCEAVDYRGSQGESGINTKLRTFKMRNGDVKTILIHTPSGVAGKCVPESWDFRGAVTFMVQTQNKLWAMTDTGNLLFMRLGPPSSYRSGRPEWFAVKTRDGSEVLNRVAQLRENPRRDGVVVTYTGGSKEEFKASDTGRLVNGSARDGVPSRAVPITASAFDAY
jgi:hypothetical protein